MEDNIRIGWLFPDQMNLHGERGNVLALIKALKNQGYSAVTEMTGINDEIEPLKYDVIFCLAGEISRFPLAAEKLKPVVSDLEEFMEKGKPLIVTGTTMGLFGKETVRDDGSVIEGLGILPLVTRERKTIYGDDILSVTHYGGKEMTLSGCQIQTADFDFEEENPFSHMKYGYGDDGVRTSEGFIIENSIFTNSLGPLLAVNPWLCDEVARVILKNRGINEFRKTPHTLEEKSLEVKSQFIMGKSSPIRKIE